MWKWWWWKQGQDSFNRHPTLMQKSRKDVSFSYAEICGLLVPIRHLN